jgi:hypothetical protein
MAECCQPHHIQSEALRLRGYVCQKAAAAAAAAGVGQMLLPDLCQACRPSWHSADTVIKAM